MFNTFDMFDQKSYENLLKPDFYIDSLQKTKSIVTDKVITDPVLNKVAHDFMDAQTEFARMMTANTTEMLKYSMANVTKAWAQQTSKKSR